MHHNEDHQDKDNDYETRSEEETLPSHTLSMRRAVQKCLDTLFLLLPDNNDGGDKKVDFERGNVDSTDAEAEKCWSEKVKTFRSAATNAEFEEHIRRYWLQLCKDDQHDAALSEDEKENDDKDSSDVDHCDKKETESDGKGYSERYLIHCLRDSALEEATLLHSRRCDSVAQFWNDYNDNVSHLCADDKVDLDEGKCDSSHPIDIVYIEDETKGQKKHDQEKSVQNGDTVDISNSTNSVSHLTPLQFKRRYIYRNIPCIIRGLDQTNFRDVTSLWRKKVSINAESPDSKKGFINNNCDYTIVNDDGDNNNHVHCEIDVKWFCEHVGNDEMVPIRKYPASTTQNDEKDNYNDDEYEHGLDEDGRAVECETVRLTMSNWINQCLKENTVMDPTMYLKDWHLMQFLEQKQQHTTQLYKVPQSFQHDLLNAFLTKFTNGDYRFVYWGPLNSYTGPHTDVLHSFSWSYNVAGEKLWTFYPPLSSKIPKPFQITQRPGETIFVPSQWKHDVRNVRHNTLSINHNWITTANVDLAWACVLAEVHAVEKEMNAWWGETKAINNSASNAALTRNNEDGHIKDDYNVDHYEARENMVRGCCGLDVTSFLLMVMTSMVDCLEILFGFSDQCCRDDDFDVMRSQATKTSEQPSIKVPNMSSLDKDELWESLFSLFRLENVLRQVFNDQSSSIKSICREAQENTCDKIDNQQVNCSMDIHVRRRLKAVLMSEDYALHTMEMTCLLLRIIEVLKNS